MFLLKNFFLFYPFFLWLNLSKIASEEYPLKPYNLTMCAMLRNEMPYVIEWIEHHRLQGVDRFILYDDDSYDSTPLIPPFYETMGFEGLIEMWPVHPYRRNEPVPHDGGHHNEKQMVMLDHCNRRCANDSEWIMVVDVDEFMYSPKNQTVWEYIESMTNGTDPQSKNAIAQFSTIVVRYGTSGAIKNFQGEIISQALSETPELKVKNPDKPAQKDFPMITLVNPKRGPHPDIDEDFKEKHDEICKPPLEPNDCTHAIGKSIWRPGRCAMSGVHFCERGLQGRSHNPRVDELRLNHYAFKSREHVNGLIDLMKPTKVRVYRDFDASWFSSRLDPMPARITGPLKEALNQFILSSLHTVN